MEKEALIQKYKDKPGASMADNNPVIGAMLETLDKSVGTLIKKLEELNLTDDTIVIFYGDNGGLEKRADQTPLRSGKASLYEGGIRVPMIARWPGVIEPGTVCDDPTTTADLLPTFCQATGAKLPDQPIDGMSMVPLFADSDADLDRDAIYFHYPHYHHSRPAGAIRAGDWKLIEFFDNAPLELYNLKDDISETTNLAEKMPDKSKQLRQMLAKWRESVGARMPTSNPKYDPDQAHQWWNRRTNEPIDIEAMARRYQSRTGKKPLPKKK